MLIQMKADSFFVYFEFFSHVVKLAHFGRLAHVGGLSHFEGLILFKSKSGHRGILECYIIFSFQITLIQMKATSSFAYFEFFHMLEDWLILEV